MVMILGGDPNTLPEGYDALLAAAATASYGF